MTNSLAVPAPCQSCHPATLCDQKERAERWRKLVLVPQSTLVGRVRTTSSSGTSIRSNLYPEQARDSLRRPARDARLCCNMSLEETPRVACCPGTGLLAKGCPSVYIRAGRQRRNCHSEPLIARRQTIQKNMRKACKDRAWRASRCQRAAASRLAAMDRRLLVPLSAPSSGIPKARVLLLERSCDGTVGKPKPHAKFSTFKLAAQLYRFITSTLLWKLLNQPPRSMTHTSAPKLNAMCKASSNISNV